MFQAQNSNCILEDLPLDDTEMPHLVLGGGPDDDDGDGKDEDSDGE